MKTTSTAPKTRKAPAPEPEWEINKTSSHIIKINRIPSASTESYCRHNGGYQGLLSPKIFAKSIYADVFVYEHGDEEYPLWSAHLTKRSGRRYWWVEIHYVGYEADNILWSMYEPYGDEIDNSGDCAETVDSMVDRARAVAKLLRKVIRGPFIQPTLTVIGDYTIGSRKAPQTSCQSRDIHNKLVDIALIPFTAPVEKIRKEILNIDPVTIAWWIYALIEEDDPEEKIRRLEIFCVALGHISWNIMEIPDKRYATYVAISSLLNGNPIDLCGRPVNRLRIDAPDGLDFEYKELTDDEASKIVGFLHYAEFTSTSTRRSFLLYEGNEKLRQEMEQEKLEQEQKGLNRTNP